MKERKKDKTGPNADGQIDGWIAYKHVQAIEWCEEEVEAKK